MQVKWHGYATQTEFGFGLGMDWRARTIFWQFAFWAGYIDLNA